jgi:ATP-dependent Clp protease ATP-binding subunit ClpX
MESRNENKDSEVFCQTCGIKNNEDSKLRFVRNPEVNFSLCEKCVYLFNDTLVKNQEPVLKEEDFIFPTPSSKEVYNFLNKHIISQDPAKKQISIAISHHFKRFKDPSIGKSNLLIVGPTGTGKTEMARAVAKFLKLPFVSTDATSLTTRGYIGENTDSIVGRLLQSCDYNVKKAEKGIIFIDEIDKLARSQNNDSQIGTVSVQQELLKIMEGTLLKIEKSGKHGRSEPVFINTKNILFICAGSFQGLEELVIKKDSEASMGFLSAPKAQVLNISKNWFDSLETEHLVKYGLIPEFLGRLPIVIQTLPLTKEDVLKIITEPEDSIINQYKKLLKIDNIEAEFGDQFLNQIVEESMTKNLGARGIRKVLEVHLKDLFFNPEQYNDQKIIIELSGITIINNNESCVL